eukprot:gene379-412_t
MTRQQQQQQQQQQPDSITPLPFWQMASVFMVQMCEGINVNVLFPFLAFMIEDMGYTGHRLGYYAGGLAAAFCGGQFCSSVLWGMISDRYGRKAAIVSGTIGAALGMIVFGSARHYPQAIIGRLVGGFLNGNVGVMKSFLTEFTDHSNRGRGFSYISVAWALGTLIAPLIGGLLCNPVEKYPSIFVKGGLFDEFPYLLPCLIAAICSLLTATLCSVVMKETRTLSSSSDGDDDTAATSSSSSSSNRALEMVKSTAWKIVKGGGRRSGDKTNSGRSGHYEAVAVQEEDVMLDQTMHGEGERRQKDLIQDSTPAVRATIYKIVDDNDVDETDGEESEEPSSSIKSIDNSDDVESGKQGSLTNSGKSSPSSSGALSTSEVLRQKVVLLACGSYGMLAMAYIIYDETIPLFLKLDKTEGGLSFNSTEIGLMISISGGIMLFFNFFLLPHFAAQSKRWLFEIGVLGGVPMTFAWPILAIINTHFLSHLHSHVSYYSILWPALILLSTIKNVFSCLCFTAVMIQVNHSVSEKYLGAVNGLGQSFAALARAVGPALGGALWSLSIQTENVFVNFMVVSFVLVGCGIINRHLPLSLDQKYHDPLQETSEKGGGNDDEGKEEMNGLSVMH